MSQLILMGRSANCIIVLITLLLPLVGCGNSSNAAEPVPPNVIPAKKKYRPSEIIIVADFTRYEAADESYLSIKPEIIHYVKPFYPMTSRQAGIEGTALLELIIDTDGKVESAEIVASRITPSMEQSLLKAAKRYVYRPGLRDDRPIRCKARHLIKFTLNDDAIPINFD